MLELTIGIITVLLIISYLIFDRDILAPPTAVALVFLFGSLCCLYNEKKWGLEFSIKSTGLITAGIMATIVGGLIGVYLSNLPKVGVFSLSHEKTEPQAIRVSAIKTIVVILFQLVTFAWLFLHIRRVSGMPDWISAVAIYRKASTSADISISADVRLPILLRNMVLVSWMLSVVYAYITGNNLVASKK